MEKSLGTHYRISGLTSNGYSLLVTAEEAVIDLKEHD